MESGPKNQNSLTYEQAASELYYAVDDFFVGKGSRLGEQSLGSRVDATELTLDECAPVGSMLELYTIDAPESATIVLIGHNPALYPDAQRAVVEIVLKHHTYNKEDMSTAEEIESIYYIELGKGSPQPIVAHKTQRKALTLEQAKAFGINPESIATEKQYLHYNDQEPLKQFELHGLAQMFGALK